MSTPQRLRLLHVILSRGFAGSERAAAETCNALAALRHEVAIAIRADHRGPDGASIRDFLDPGVRVHELPRFHRTQARLAELVSAWAPDVVHTHLRRGTRLVSRIRARSGVAHVSTVHIRLNGRHYLYADALFCISEWQLPSVPGSYPGQVHLLPNTLLREPRISPEERRALRAEFGAGPHDFVVGSVGRLVSSKGIDVLIRAFKAAGLPRARLVVVGDGRERARLSRLADARVTLLGYRADAKRLMQAFDLLACPSRHEPFGRVIMEALDAETPVVASDVAGPRDIATQYPIELVPSGDAVALAAAMQRAAARGQVRVRCDLAQFDTAHVIARQVSAYREVLVDRAVRATGSRFDEHRSPA